MVACKGCVIPACTIQDRLNTRKISFHRFPPSNQREMQEKWIQLVRKLRQDASWEPHEQAVVCSRHFTSTQVQKIGKRGKLLGWHVPSLFLQECDQVTKELDVDHVQPTVQPPTTPQLPANQNQPIRSDTRGCFLCSILTLSTGPHSDHVKEQIRLFKDLLNQAAFNQGLTADASFSLVYPSEGDENSCLSCLTTVAAVWALDREIILLKERIKKMVEKSLNQHAEKFINRAKAENDKLQAKESKGSFESKRKKQIDGNISPKREKLEVCDQAVFDWMIAASTPPTQNLSAASSSSTSGPIEPTEVNCVTEFHPLESTSPLNSPMHKPVVDEESPIISTPSPYSNEDNNGVEKEAVTTNLVKIETDNENFFEFEEAEEMPTGASTPNFTPRVITSSNSVSQDQEDYVLYEGDRPYGCSRCVCRFVNKSWVVRHMNKCKGMRSIQ